MQWHPMTPALHPTATPVHVQVLLMRLRQVCIHPQLALVPGGEAAGVPGAKACNMNGPDPLAGEPLCPCLHSCTAWYAMSVCSEGGHSNQPPSMLQIEYLSPATWSAQRG